MSSFWVFPQCSRCLTEWKPWKGQSVCKEWLFMQTFGVNLIGALTHSSKPTFSFQFANQLFRHVAKFWALVQFLRLSSFGEDFDMAPCFASFWVLPRFEQQFIGNIWICDLWMNSHGVFLAILSFSILTESGLSALFICVALFWSASFSMRDSWYRDARDFWTLIWVPKSLGFFALSLCSCSWDLGGFGTNLVHKTINFTKARPREYVWKTSFWRPKNVQLFTIQFWVRVEVGIGNLTPVPMIPNRCHSTQFFHHKLLQISATSSNQANGN